MKHFMTIHRAVIAVMILLGLSVVGVALADYAYFVDGAELETWTQGDGWWAKTQDTTNTYRYHVYTNLRGWGGSDDALKDEAVSDCYHCVTTLGTGDNAIANYWNYGATQHRSRKEITWTEYAGFTSDDGNHSSYSCWSTHCGF